MIGFDASRLEDERCRRDDPTHLSYALIAMSARRATVAPIFARP